MNDSLARLTAALADRYRIERELGAGGMATVYLAEDPRHQRKVAVKVLRPELAAALGHERFLREITTTANLRHPHILPLYDSGQTGGRNSPANGQQPPANFLFYVMPFVEGETLRDRLDREKQLPVAEALQIAREVADALSYAHSRGVIHRDIKPENILLESGHAVVADFGIARAVDAAGGDRLTETGLSIGTPTYMSPEQAAGEREADGRSDLYALGCVLYEMLTGQPPFTGATADVVIRQHLAVDPTPVAALRPSVPEHVAAALSRALAKNPADRFNPVAQFNTAIQSDVEREESGTGAHTTRRLPTRVVAVGVGGIAIVAAALFGLSRLGSGGDDDVAPSVAVLPFTDLSPGQSDAYLGDGIAETLTNALANVDGLEVAARSSAFSFRGTSEDAREIGRTLGVATVLEGSVQRAGGRLRITAQLVKTTDGLHLWSQSFDRESDDIFALQDEVAAAVAEALRGRLVEGRRLAGTGTTNPAAYDAYLQGRFHWSQRTVSELERAIGYFEDAIALDSSYANAWAGLGDAYLVMPFYSTAPSSEFVPRAREAAEHALRLNPDLAEAHATLAYALTVYYWEWEAAEEAFARAIALNPDYPLAHKWHSDLLRTLGRYDESLQVVERAVALDPRSPNARTVLGLTRWCRGEGEDTALAELDRALELDPTYPLTLMHASWLHWMRGDTAAFFRARERLEAVSERGEVAVAQLRRAYAAGGADSVMRLEATAPALDPHPLDRARWHALLGDLDAAFADLEEAVSERVVWLPFGLQYPDLARLADDPRYRAILERMGLY